jgi:hypothetical protein
VSRVFPLQNWSISQNYLCLDKSHSTNIEGLKYDESGKAYWSGRVSTVDLLIITRLDQHLFMLKTNPFCKTTYLNEEVNGTEPSPSFGIPWMRQSKKWMFCNWLSSVIGFGWEWHFINYFLLLLLSSLWEHDMDHFNLVNCALPRNRKL